MSSEILSQNDIDALLGDVGSGKSGLRERPVKQREPQLYDFRRPHRVSKERLRTLQAMYERFAKTIEGWIMGRVRDQVELTLQSVEQLSFGDLALSLPTPCCSFMLEVENSGGEQGVIDFGHEFGCFLVDRLLGGRGEAAVLDRALTPIERMIVRTVADRISVAIADIWTDYVQLELKLTGFESIPEILRASGGDTAVLVASIEVAAGGRRGLMSVCLPFAVLDSFFADTTKPRRNAATGSTEEQRASRRMAEASLRSARLPVAARLPEFRIPMRELAGLQAGSVLATGIPTNTEVELLVNEQPRFRGKPARVGKRLAVRLTETMEQHPAADADSLDALTNLDQ